MRNTEVYQLLKIHGWQLLRKAKGRHELFRHPSGKTLLVSIAGRSRDMSHNKKRALLAEIRGGDDENRPKCHND